MGLGLSIQTIGVPFWPTEEIQVVCSQCGSILLLTRYERFPDRQLPPEYAARESEQLCGVCGTPACKETEGIKTVLVKNRSQDFFSSFKR